MAFINWKMRVTLSDTRTLLGIFLAFDKHMNLVLADTDEYRKVKPKKGSGETAEREEKRSLGLVLLRGDAIISLSPEAPPAPQSRAKLSAAKGGPGSGAAAGRGMPAAPLASAPKGLAGPVRGVGGPAASAMMPSGLTASGAAVTYNRPPPGAPSGQPGQGGFPRPPMPGMPGMPMPPFGMMGMGARPGMFPPRPPMPGMPGMMMRPPPGFPGMMGGPRPGMGGPMGGRPPRPSGNQ